MKRISLIRKLGIIVMLLAVANLCMAFMPYEKDLRGKWKFRIGDQHEWASPAYDDSDWDEIRVPARWEDEGYRGYDGFAWYRTTFTVDTGQQNQILLLELGYIDDVDEVFLNGIKVGQSGTFPPNYSSAFNALRKYNVPKDIIRFGGENLLAVRVYDNQIEGGIISGMVRITSGGIQPPFVYDLTGPWLFNKGKTFDEQNHQTILVPGTWEDQGYYHYDGYAVYARKLKITKELAEKSLVLLAGKIDDADRLYINGQLIASTGYYDDWHNSGFYNEFRNYFIPPGTFKAGEENMIEIRVLDIKAHGGIFEGPVGIMTQEDFRAYWKAKRRN